MPPIRDLGLIGDRRTAALVSRAGEIVWYCPGRFDAPSVLARLIDPDGGSWRIEFPGAAPAGRRYLGESGVLETRLRAPGGEIAVTDWLTLGDAPAGLLCRMLTPAPDPVTFRLRLRPDYARRASRLVRRAAAVAADVGAEVHASHPLSIERDEVVCIVPAGEAAWMAVSDAAMSPPASTDVEGWLAATLEAWYALADRPDDGPFGRALGDSIRALRLLTHAPTGGIVAAATASLPEILGGGRNYDYRYVWLRDAAMIVSAMLRAGDGGLSAERFLGVVCSTRGTAEGMPLPPLATLDGSRAPGVETLPLAGYCDSRPVRVGNVARDQLQLDGYGNVLLAAKQIYGQSGGERPHWETVRAIADYLAAHWHEPDHGIWEEEATRHYTSSKVIAACGLDWIAEFADDRAQAARWRGAVRDVGEFVARECRTPDGTYAAFAGGRKVDVSAALFPVWGYCRPDTPEMLGTMTALERCHSPDGLLFRRTLVLEDAGREGAFLAGTFWVAQYQVMRGDLDRARRIIERALAFANDLGLFAEEADPKTGEMLGNFPQSFVHAAFIGAVVDLRAALDPEPPER